jgi:hypothetical protein
MPPARAATDRLSRAPPRRRPLSRRDAWGGALAKHYDDHGYYARVNGVRND